MLHTVLPPGLCSSRARWPMAPNFCSWVTRKSKIFHTNHMLGTLDFAGSEHWALFNFPESKALYHLHSQPYLQIKWSPNRFLLIPQLPPRGPLRLSSALAMSPLQYCQLSWIIQETPDSGPYLPVSNWSMKSPG